MPKRKQQPARYEARLIVSVVYRSNDAHDQTFYEMFEEIFQTAQKEFKKYKFEIDNLQIVEQQTLNIIEAEVGR